MDESILASIKPFANVEEDDDSFDSELIGYINTAFALLRRIGAGPKEGFIITDDTTTWREFTDDKVVFALAKTYVGQKVKLEFDISSLSSAVIEAMKRSNAEIEWTLNNYVD
jgi:hypothetical protein